MFIAAPEPLTGNNHGRSSFGLSMFSLKAIIATLLSPASYQQALPFLGFLGGLHGLA